MSKSYKIAVMGGDGTGPEVTDEALKVAREAASKFDFKLDTQDFDFGGERYMRTGETLPDSAVEELRGFDAILLGAIGHPDVAPGILEKGILLKARFELEEWLRGHAGDSLEERVRLDYTDCLLRLIENDLSVARFYRRIDKQQGARLHAERALADARGAQLAF